MARRRRWRPATPRRPAPRPSRGGTPRRNRTGPPRRAGRHPHTSRDATLSHAEPMLSARRLPAWRVADGGDQRPRAVQHRARAAVEPLDETGPDHLGEQVATHIRHETRRYLMLSRCSARGDSQHGASPTVATSDPAPSSTAPEPRWNPSTKPDRTTSASRSPPTYVTRRDAISC